MRCAAASWFFGSIGGSLFAVQARLRRRVASWLRQSFLPACLCCTRSPVSRLQSPAGSELLALVHRRARELADPLLLLGDLFPMSTFFTFETEYG